MSSNNSVAVKAVWSDHRNTLEMTLPGSENTVAMAVGTLGLKIPEHVGLKSLGLNSINMPVKYFPDVEPSDMLSVCRSSGLTAVFTPNPATQRRIKIHLAQNAQTSVEPNTTSIASSSSTTNPPQVTMDSQLKEILASMQKEIAEVRGKNESILTVNERFLKEIGSMRNENKRILNENERILNENGSMRNEIKTIRSENKRILNENERILNENGSMRNEIESMRNENGSMRNEIERILNENESIHHDNERIDSELASVRKDLDAARVKHTEDVEALRVLTLSLVPLHLRVLLDRARGKILEHLGHESWEGLRDSCSIHQLANDIFNGLKQKGVSYTPPYQAIYFLCSYNNIRRAGNTAAHTAKVEEVRHAVLTQPLESRDRGYLENLFTYAYDGRQL